MAVTPFRNTRSELPSATSAAPGPRRRAPPLPAPGAPTGARTRADHAGPRAAAHPGAAPRNTKPAFRGKPQAPAFPTVGITSACAAVAARRPGEEGEGRGPGGGRQPLALLTCGRGRAQLGGNAGCHGDCQRCGSTSQRRSCGSLLPPSLSPSVPPSVPASVPPPPPPPPAQPRLSPCSAGTRRGGGSGWRGSLPGCSGRCASPPACPRRSGGTPEHSGPWRRWVAPAFPRRFLSLPWCGAGGWAGGQPHPSCPGRQRIRAGLTLGAVPQVRVGGMASLLARAWWLQRANLLHTFVFVVSHRLGPGSKSDKLWQGQLVNLRGNPNRARRIKI